MFISEIKVRVLYAHTDKMGVVYYGKYYEYFEAGRNEMLRDLGLPYAEIESLGFASPVIKSHCEYFNPAKYDQLINIKCTMKEMPTAIMKIEYEVTHNETAIVTGYTEHCFVNIGSFKPVRPPQKLIELIRKFF